MVGHCVGRTDTMACSAETSDGEPVPVAIPSPAVRSRTEIVILRLRAPGLIACSCNRSGIRHVLS